MNFSLSRNLCEIIWDFHSLWIQLYDCSTQKNLLLDKTPNSFSLMYLSRIKKNIIFFFLLLLHTYYFSLNGGLIVFFFLITLHFSIFLFLYYLPSEIHFLLSWFRIQFYIFFLPPHKGDTWIKAIKSFVILSIYSTLIPILYNKYITSLTMNRLSFYFKE